MTTADAIKNRSSTRAYTAEPLTEAEIRALIHAGLKAPTATNRQEIHFTVLSGDNPLLEEIECEMDRIWNRTERRESFYYNAPTVIIISAEKGFKWSPVDAGIAVENIALAAEELGLGSVIVGCFLDVMYGEKAEYFNKAMDFPEGYGFEIAIAVGHKAAGKEPHTYDESRQVTYL